MEDGGRVLVLSAEEGMVAHMARGECVIGVMDGHVPPPLPSGCYLVEEEESVDEDLVDRVYARFRHKPWKIGETEKLILRELTVEDLSELYRLEQGMRSCEDISGILGDVPNTAWKDLSEEERKEYAGRLASYIEHQYAFYEYGLWGIFHKPEGKLIGMCGFSTTDEVDMSLGYYVFPTYRRYGYATQSCRMAMDFVRDWIRAEEVFAVIDKENLASQSIVFTLDFMQMKDDGKKLRFRKNLVEEAKTPETKDSEALWDRLKSAAGKYFRRS